LPNRFWLACRRILWRPSVVSVILIVAVWNLIISSHKLASSLRGRGLWRETANDVREGNVHLQLRLYQWLSSLPAVPRAPKRVSLVFIDDATHWSTLYGDMPTNRSYLAQLIKHASQPNTKAAVIGLDIELDAPLAYVPGMDEPDPKRIEQNKALLGAIFWAADHGVPVVLTGGYVHKDGRKMRLPTIYKDPQLPLKGTDGSCDHAACARLGYVNVPEDRRQIPLVEEYYEWEGSGPFLLDSFALSMVEASDGTLQTTRKNHLVDYAISHKRPLFGTFMTEDAFPLIDVDALYRGDPAATSACRDRIVLIGGRWHELHGYGALVDGHLSPAGMISGLSFHANYVESLLNDWFSREVPVWVAIVIDAIVGLVIYGLFGSLRKWKFLAIVVSSLIPVGAAYIALVNFNRYLDFLLPVELYFVHLCYETVQDYVHSKRFKIDAKAV
jgi:CHASE2 domain-containing sensor protein